MSSVKFHVIDPKCLVRIASSFFHQQSDIDFSENMQFKLHFFFPIEKVFSYKKNFSGCSDTSWAFVS